MRLGIISEGHSDRAVLVNILQGITELDIANIKEIIPIYALDETDKAIFRPETYGGWATVKKECEEKKFIEEFLIIEGNYLVIQIDAAEATNYGVTKSNNKIQDYAEETCHLIKSEIIKWLNIQDESNILFAIPVEEIEAWIIAIHEDRDTSKIKNPKKHLEYAKKIPTGKMKPNYDLYYDYSLLFNRRSQDKKGALEQRHVLFSSRNYSLFAFLKEIKTKLFNIKGELLN